MEKGLYMNENEYNRRIMTRCFIFYWNIKFHKPCFGKIIIVNSFSLFDFVTLLILENMIFFTAELLKIYCKNGCFSKV